MQYFKYFPKLQYDLDDNKATKEIVDVFRFAKIVSNTTVDDITLYSYYDVIDGERPDHVSQRLYGTPDYYWTFFLVNPEMKNLFNDWPMSTSQLQDHVDLAYPGHVLNSDDDFFNKFNIGETVQGILSSATGVVAAKDPNLGWIRITGKTGSFRAESIQGQTSNDIITITGETNYKYATHHFSTADGIVPKGTAGAVKVTNEQYEFDENDKRRRIKVVKPEKVGDIAQQFRNIING